MNWQQAMSNPRKQVFKAAEYQNRLSVQREVIEDSENTMVAKVAALEPRFEHGFSYISIYLIVPLGTGAAMRVIHLIYQASWALLFQAAAARCGLAAAEILCARAWWVACGMILPHFIHFTHGLELLCELALNLVEFGLIEWGSFVTVRCHTVPQMRFMMQEWVETSIVTVLLPFIF